jgi:phenylalanyl-tRNA synthetase beta chain
MTISYHRLSEYLPEKIEPQQLSEMLTSIGLEVESMEHYHEIPGSLKGLIVGEVVSCEKHPDADKLKLTTVNIGAEELLHIVCGAPNVAAGQKVIVAPIGCTIYPIKGEPFTIKKAKIRGAESQGMLCAEDEIGLGESHDGLKLLPQDCIPGTPIATLFQPYEDIIYEIGLTPNRMDAQSHLGVARDVCAYLSYHKNSNIQVVSPLKENPSTSNQQGPIQIILEDTIACPRYTGIYIQNVLVEESPLWLKQKLKSIGLKPVNNIVDITNYILHETGQPLHAFDADKIKGKQVIVKKALAGERFITLDGKAHTLSAADLMICDKESSMCIAGVYGGLESGVTASTTNIFLECAAFEKIGIRKTALAHQLRTDAAIRFEKGIDIGQTLQVLYRAVQLIVDIAGGEMLGDATDIYPNPRPKTSIHFELEFLRKLSGKTYESAAVKRILIALGFEINAQDAGSMQLLVPYSKTDISIPADIVEEVMRIDGLDNIPIPQTISIAPSAEAHRNKHMIAEKIAGCLTGMGFHEIFTNSITNSAFYDEATLQHSVKMINSLSNELDMLRPEMLPSALQVVAHNLNRKNNNLQLFEIGKTYTKTASNPYKESQQLSLVLTGNIREQHWQSPVVKADYFYLKGVAERMLGITGINNFHFVPAPIKSLESGCILKSGDIQIGFIGAVDSHTLKRFDIKHQVFYAELDMAFIFNHYGQSTTFKEISRFPAVNRDLALVVEKNISFAQLEQIALTAKITQLSALELFDIFESEKLGAGKKSMALSFTFMDEGKTLTDQEIDGFMQQLIGRFEQQANAEIRK